MSILRGNWHAIRNPSKVRRLYPSRKVTRNRESEPKKAGKDTHAQVSVLTCGKEDVHVV